MAEIVHEVPIKTGPPQLFAMLTEESLLSKWWLKGARIEAKAGAIGSFPLSDGLHQITMRVSELIPDKKVVWQCLNHKFSEWKDTELSFEIFEEPSGLILRFRHSGWKATDGVFGKTSYYWASLYLQNLKRLLEVESARDGKNERINFGVGISMPVQPNQRERAELFLSKIIHCKEIMRNDTYTCFEFPSGQVIGITPDPNAPAELEYKNTTWLEIVSSNFKVTKKRIQEFGVREVPGSDEGTYFFHLPGGAVFRLISEDTFKA